MKKLSRFDRRRCSLNLAGLTCFRRARFLVGQPAKAMAWCAKHALMAMAWLRQQGFVRPGRPHRSVQK